MIDMVSSRSSFYTPEYSPDYDAKRTNQFALQWLIENAKNKRAFVAVHIPRNLDPIFEGILSQGAVNQLRSKGRAMISAVEILRLTRNKHVTDAGNSPIVVFHPSMDLLNKLDSIRNVSAMLVVPITLNEVRQWIDKWKAGLLDF
jgi:hypothetical protein